MGREERRRAERQQRRAGRGAVEATVAAGRPPDGALARAILEELEGQGTPSRSTMASGAGSAGSQASAPPSPTAADPVRQTPAPATLTTAAGLLSTSVGCDALNGADPQALGLTYTFESPTDGEPLPMTIRFDGRRSGVSGPPGPDERFSALETIDRVMPGAGRVTVTTRVENIASGEWEVTAGPVLDPVRPTGSAARPVPAPTQASAITGFAPVIRVRAPGVRIGAWPALVGVGAAVALATQSLLARAVSLPQATVLLLSLVACLVGLVAARVYYAVEHPNRRRGWMNTSGGVCIQGFVLGAVGTVIVGALLIGLPVGTLLDVTAPGLLFGMAIGRVGCFFGGCCAGRPTGSRWGLWSSDRRLGARRVPTQLFESTLALIIGLAALLVVMARPDPAGVVFVAAISAYTLGRQLLFPLRSLPRNTAHGRTLAIALGGLVLVAAVAVAVLA